MNKVYRTVYNLRKRLPKLVTRYGDYLEPGNYRLNIVEGIYAWCEGTSLGRLNSGWTFHERSRMVLVVKAILTLLFARVVKVPGGPKKFNGTVIKFHYTFAYVKIFDLKREELVTLYGDDKREQEIAENKEKLSYYYPVPRTLRRIDGTMVEALMLNETDETELKFAALLSFMGDYFIHTKKKGRYAFRDMSGHFRGHEDSYIQELVGKLRTDKPIVLPELILHGDCWKSNILYHDQQIYFIDYETVDTYSFLYDIFKFGYSETLYNKNPELLNQYMNGIFDTMMMDYFKIFGLSYEVDSRRDYFLIFLMELYLRKGVGQSRKNQLDMQKRIVYFLHKYY